MLNKEECLKARDIIYNYVNCDEMTTEEFNDSIVVFNNLIKEHFELKEKIKTGELSDGYHTFNELYHHRAVLFSIICNQNKAIAWKSKKHDDGTMFDGMFIVGIKTPLGQYTYHYDIKPYWEMFDVKELENAPKWDGHQPKDIDRLFSINDNPPLKFEELKENMWVFDNLNKMYVQIEEDFDEGNGVILLRYHEDSYNSNCERTRFEENRFYRYEVKLR